MAGKSTAVVGVCKGKLADKYLSRCDDYEEGGLQMEQLIA